MSWIKLNSGKKFDYENPEADMISLHDIAHNLSKEQRFANCLDRDWTVAHHSLLVKKLSEIYGLDEDIQYMALHHDSPEAYMRDLPTPLKRMLPGYKMIYGKVERAIENKLQLRLSPLSPKVKELDALAMYIEDTRFSTKDSDWHNFNEESIEKLSDELDHDINREIHKLYILRQWQVYQYFLRTHNYLADKLNIEVKWEPQNEQREYGESLQM